MTALDSVGFRALAPNLYWREDAFSFFGVRGNHSVTVVRLNEQCGGGLWIHSPFHFSEELWSELEAWATAGSPRHLVIPSRTHDLHLEGWMQRIPRETTYAPGALWRAHPDWELGQTLTDDFCCPWSAEIDHQRLLGAPRVNEVAFFHKPSRTLILVDCVFNMERADSLWGRIVSNLYGAGPGLATSRLYRLLIRDKRAFRESLERVLEWEFERVIVGHGQVIEAPGVGALRAHLKSL